MFTSAAKAVFFGAQGYARQVGSEAISLELFLMALLGDRECDAGRVLDALALDREAARDELRRLAPRTASSCPIPVICRLVRSTGSGRAANSCDSAHHFVRSLPTWHWEAAEKSVAPSVRREMIRP
jgi:hypothetical protein